MPIIDSQYAPGAGRNHLHTSNSEAKNHLGQPEVQPLHTDESSEKEDQEESKTAAHKPQNLPPAPPDSRNDAIFGNGGIVAQLSSNTKQPKSILNHKGGVGDQESSSNYDASIFEDEGDTSSDNMDDSEKDEAARRSLGTAQAQDH